MKLLKTRLRSRLNEACKDKAKEQKMKLLKTRLRSRLNEAFKDKAKEQIK